MAFAAAQLVFGYLNSSTAFLGSIILGNGINYAIVLMSRYEEEKALRAPMLEALATAVGGVWKGTAVAALSASVAYASLMVTSFRGFSQFGVMGGAGWLLCWLATFLLLPVLMLTLDGARATGPRARPPARIAWLAPGATPLRAGFVDRSRWWSPCWRCWARGISSSDPFEYDFRKLNTRTSTTRPSEQVRPQHGLAVRPLALTHHRPGRRGRTTSRS